MSDNKKSSTLQHQSFMLAENHTSDTHTQALPATFLQGGKERQDTKYSFSQEQTSTDKKLQKKQKKIR